MRGPSAFRPGPRSGCGTVAERSIHVTWPIPRRATGSSRALKVAAAHRDQRSLLVADSLPPPPAALRGRARSLDLVERPGEQRAHRIGAGEIEPRGSLLIRSTCRSRQWPGDAISVPVRVPPWVAVATAPVERVRVGRAVLVVARAVVLAVGREEARIVADRLRAQVVRPAAVQAVIAECVVARSRWRRWRRLRDMRHRRL
jgi:hypothetical protein